MQDFASIQHLSDFIGLAFTCTTVAIGDEQAGATSSLRSRSRAETLFAVQAKNDYMLLVVLTGALKALH